jgi:S1-C subfamily serine protease
MLGVYVDLAYVAGPYGAEPGIRITSVWPGYPSYGRLDPGDIITRVNGIRVRSVPEFQGAMASAGPFVYLRLRDVRTGAIVDVPPIALQQTGYPAAAAAAAPMPAAAAPAAPAAPGAPAPLGPNVP